MDRERHPPFQWSPSSREDISLPFKGQNTPGRVGLMLRAEESSLPGPQPFHTLPWAPPHNQFPKCCSPPLWGQP